MTPEKIDKTLGTAPAHAGFKIAARAFRPLFDRLVSAASAKSYASLGAQSRTKDRGDGRLEWLGLFSDMDWLAAGTMLSPDGVPPQAARECFKVYAMVVSALGVSSVHHDAWINMRMRKACRWLGVPELFQEALSRVGALPPHRLDPDMRPSGRRSDQYAVEFRMGVLLNIHMAMMEDHAAVSLKVALMDRPAPGKDHAMDRRRTLWRAVRPLRLPWSKCGAPRPSPEDAKHPQFRPLFEIGMRRENGNIRGFSSKPKSFEVATESPDGLGFEHGYRCVVRRFEVDCEGTTYRFDHEFKLIAKFPVGTATGKAS